MEIEVGKAEKGFLSVYPVHTWWSLSARHHLKKKNWLEDVRYQLHSAWYI